MADKGRKKLFQPSEVAGKDGNSGNESRRCQPQRHRLAAVPFSRGPSHRYGTNTASGVCEQKSRRNCFRRLSIWFRFT